MDSSKFAQLMQWIDRGWALVPVHDVSAGVCSCRTGPMCKNPGKHPRWSAWQEEGQLVRTEQDLDQLTKIGNRGTERWNWGVATGEASGMWVLDWDVAHDAEIRSWLRGRGGAVPAGGPPDLGTLVLGPTGGRGWHYVFALPRDFVPRGSQTRNRHGLPPGLDVRGVHGQIVVAPSVSGKGAYGGVLLDRSVAAAPGWLEDMLRPREREVSSAAPPRVEGTALRGPLDARGAAYARGVVRGELERMRAARPGERDEVAFSVVCRLVEVMNAGWFGADELWGWALEARLSVADAGREDIVELDLEDKWRRAEVRVGGAAAVVPEGGGSLAGAGGLEYSGFREGTRAGATAEPGVPSERQLDGDMAQRVAAMEAQLLTGTAIRALPRPVPLVNGVLDMGSTALLLGRPGSFKSFIALDLAVHVGRGEAWRGRRVRQGLVLYLAAEGQQGVSLRLDAIEREFGHDAPGVAFLPLPVPADERAAQAEGLAGPWSVLVEVVDRMKPVLVVIDTQSRVTAGLNENSAGDMAYYAEQADRLKRASGACVLSIHHQGRTGTNVRGSSAIDGALDTVLRVQREGESMLISVYMDKQKDQAQEAPIQMALRVSGEGIRDADTGRDLSSLIVVPKGSETAEELGHEGDEKPQPMRPDDKLTPGQRADATVAYNVLLAESDVDEFGGEGPGLREAEWRKAAMAALPGGRKRNDDARAKAWQRAFSILVQRNLVLRRASEARFKILVLKNQSEDGVLTRFDHNMDNVAHMPDGWNLYVGSLTTAKSRNQDVS